MIDRCRAVCIALSLLVPAVDVMAQTADHDPCGEPDTTGTRYKLLAATNWGYGYDSLLADVSGWRQSPFAVVDSIGASVQGRTLFRLTVTDPLAGPTSRPRIWIHARTHPQEVEGTWVTDEMIRILLSDDPLASALRFKYIFSILPMYNPDGVELGSPRRNANGVDLESNWTASMPEPEVIVLKGQFEHFMASGEPIRLALNMHSSSAGRRYFVYHSPVGTSERFATLEQTFIRRVRDHTPGRIEPWNYFVSWTSGTALQYPESWFWTNHREFVMALTYEDIYGVTNGGFDTTAEALLRGVDDYLSDPLTSVPEASFADTPEEVLLDQNYPNPYNGRTIIRFVVRPPGRVMLAVYDLMGREVERLVDGPLDGGVHHRTFSSDRLASGTYLCRLTTPAGIRSRMMTVLR